MSSTNLKHGEASQRNGTVSTKDLIEQPIQDLNGKLLGRLGEIVFDAGRGMAAYVLIDCVDDSRCALPYEMLRIEVEPMCIHAKVHRDVFLGSDENDRSTEVDTVDETPNSKG